MTNNNSYLVLYANCIPVKGAIRSTICDLQRGKWYYIPNDLYEILINYNKCKLGDIYSKYEKTNHEILNEYFAFILKNDLGFLDDDLRGFVALNNEWDYPGHISNCVIDIDNLSFANFKYKEVIDQLDQLNCACLQYRLFDGAKPSTVKKLLSFTLDTRLNDIKLVLKYDKDLDDLLRTLIDKHKRLSQIVYFGANESSVDIFKDVQIIYMTHKTLTAGDCGVVCPSMFSVNTEHYTESLNYNTCLNKKVSIDASGFIKNCPSQTESFGHIDADSIFEVISNQMFQELWKIKKDDVQVCKDCEHRYICTDCRIFINSPEDKFSKPKKCTYDPYTASWI
ncbi:Radical SAM domain protein [Fulvivirga imtechensis AK7]|uniref:Radical SAM domain protein n=1 Tax=Fulvivirga imtechensis AK7 TaxID=1237149 RepID=L8JJI9_9BACT|nr:grasp-with-spasm system SPASM domain peptide maturase [Fulvivirga imtechensis]ELR68408.1 Radical SAM domain protein [Fulvivirga imtechensis AK7]